MPSPPRLLTTSGPLTPPPSAANSSTSTPSSNPPTPLLLTPTASDSYPMSRYELMYAAAAVQVNAQMNCLASFLVVFSLFALAGAARAQTVAVPFDFSQSEIGVDVTVNGAHLYILLDTGVDPSVIDLHRAEALRLKIDRKGAGELSGFGNDKGAAAFPTFIQGLAIAGHKFAGFDALTGDMSALSEHYGRRVDAFIGYSFLKDKIILIDYLQHNVYLL